MRPGGVAHITAGPWETKEEGAARMPWTNSSGGGGNNAGGGGPWNRGPASGGGGGMRPPDIEDMLRRGQDRLRSFLPGPGFGTAASLKTSCSRPIASISHRRILCICKAPYLLERTISEIYMRR